MILIRGGISLNGNKMAIWALKVAAAVLIGAAVVLLMAKS